VKESGLRVVRAPIRRLMLDTVIDIAPLRVRVRSPLASVAGHLQTFYADRERSGHGRFVDFDVQLLPGRGWRRWWVPQVRFVLDGLEPFFPLPAAQAAPMLEWGLNWCVAQRPLQWLVAHAAVLARGDQALVLPGFPGAGKSTLCAALTHLDGWRLLSDELAILDPATGMLQPHPRPISVKNASIPVVSAFPEARIGPVYRDTRKGDLSHLACPGSSVRQAAVPARVRWIVFPRFEAGTPPRVEPVSRTEAFALIAEQSFNQHRLGARGFEALCAMLDAAECHEISYGSTSDSLSAIRQVCGAS
jgi:HprK-related kinase A